MMKKYKVFASLISLICLFCTINSSAQDFNIDSLFSYSDDEPGGAVAVFKDGKYIYQKSFGIGNMDYETKITNETLFEIGGLSMHITASCILKLEDQGKLKLTDNINKYLDDLPAYQEGDVTINHLFNHTSGIMDYLGALNMSGKSMDEPFNSNDAYDLIKRNSKLGFEPGREYEYSNSNYLLLNQLIRKVSGQSINEYASANLFKPIGMTNTIYYDDAAKSLKNRAIAYGNEEGNYVINHHYNFTAVGDGRLYTCLKDLMLWAEALDQRKSPVSNHEARLTRRGLVNNGSEISYALGLEHGVEMGFPFYGHTGFWAGFTAMFLKVPELDFWVITLSNNESISAPNKAYSVIDLVLADIAKNEPPVKPLKVSAKSLQKYEGDYITYKNGYLRKIQVVDDTLRYQVNPTVSYKLQPIAKDRFKILGTITNYKIQFDIRNSNATAMQFLRNEVVDYSYEKYEPISDKTADLSAFTGNYQNTSLGIKYELKATENNDLAVYVNDELLMTYIQVMSNLFCSESTHHGYLYFDLNARSFTVNDYSFKPMLFEKVNN